jgi:hypothetical protein
LQAHRRQRWAVTDRQRQAKLNGLKLGSKIKNFGHDVIVVTIDRPNAVDHRIGRPFRDQVSRMSAVEAEPPCIVMGLVVCGIRAGDDLQHPLWNGTVANPKGFTFDPGHALGRDLASFAVSKATMDLNAEIIGDGVMPEAIERMRWWHSDETTKILAGRITQDNAFIARLRISPGNLVCEASRVSRRLLSVRRSYNEQRKEQVFT